MKKVAFLVASSPTDAFYSQIAALAARLQRLAWSRWRPRVHVFVGGDRTRDTGPDWRPYLPDVEIHWTSDQRFSREGDWAQSDDAFRFAPSDAELLVALDADTFPITDLEPLLERVLATGAVAGCIAHYPTVLDFEFDARSSRFTLRSHSNDLLDAWARLAEGLIDVPLDFAYTHPLMGPDCPVRERISPFYVNFGLVVFPREAFDLVAPRYLDIRPS